MTDLVKMLKALSDENRFKIFNMLLKGETCACELLDNLNIAQPTLSRHMKVLVDSGLVKGRKDAQWIRYSIDKSALGELKEYFKGLDPGAIPLINPECDCKR